MQETVWRDRGGVTQGSVLEKFTLIAAVASGLFMLLPAVFSARGKLEQGRCTRPPVDTYPTKPHGRAFGLVLLGCKHQTV